MDARIVPRRRATRRRAAGLVEAFARDNATVTAGAEELPHAGPRGSDVTDLDAVELAATLQQAALHAAPLDLIQQVVEVVAAGSRIPSCAPP